MFSKGKLKTSYAGPKIWNALPSAVRESDSLELLYKPKHKTCRLKCALSCSAFYYFTLIFVEFQQ